MTNIFLTEYDYTSDDQLTGLTDEIGTYQKVTYDEGNLAATINGAGDYVNDTSGSLTMEVSEP